ACVGRSDDSARSTRCRAYAKATTAGAVPSPLHFRRPGSPLKIKPIKSIDEAMRKKRRRPKSRRFLYGLRYRLGEHVLRCFVRLLPNLPEGLVLAFTRFTARIAFMLLRSYRKRMHENIAAVFGKEISERERKALVWAAWLSFTRGVLDTTQAMHCSKEQILAAVRLEGEDHIQRALEHGKGVLA